MEHYRALKEHLEEHDKKVKDYWKQDNPAGWREWVNFNDILPEDLLISFNTLLQELRKRQIQKEESPEILRWGNNPSGTFRIKEAYNQLQNLTNNQVDKKWKRLWNRQHWPKIKLFLWLLTHRKTLTWDNLQRKGFQGPSVCCLCMRDNESINHLLNTFHFTSNIWSWLLLVFGVSHRNMISIHATLDNWSSDFSS